MSGEDLHPSRPSETERLLADFLAGEISGVDARILESHLDADESLRDDLRALLRLDGYIRAAAAQEGAAEPDAVGVLMRQIEARVSDDPGLLGKIERRIATPIPRRSVAKRLEHRRSKRRKSVAVAGAFAAAAALLIAFGLQLFPRQVGSRGGLVVSLRGRATLSRAGQSADAAVGSRLEAGDLVRTYEDSSVSVRYRDGTKLSLDGVALLELAEEEAAKRYTLVYGELSAHVAPQPAGSPLVVRTADCSVTVRGTSFTLTAAPAQSLLSVETGEVEMKRNADGAAALVHAGEYVISSEGESKLVVRRIGEVQEEYDVVKDVVRALGGATLALASTLAQAQDLVVSIRPEGAAYGLLERAGDKPDPVKLKMTFRNNTGTDARVRLALSAEDMFGEAVDWRETVSVSIPSGGTAEKTVEMRVGWGFYTVRAKGGSVAVETELGVIPPHHPGIRKDSFFASNTSGLKRDDELKLLEMIGMKVERAHFQPHVMDNAASRPPTGQGLPLDLEGKAREFENAKQHDTWVLPIVGYAFENAKSDLANQTGMHGPPRDFEEFVKTWEQIVRRFPEIETYEFWNEPWIFGWTWAAPPEEYRKLQEMWSRMALRVNPRLRIIAGNSSMFVTDHIEPYPSSWKGLINGTTHHPYCYSTSATTFRSGDSIRSIDDGMDTTRRMKLPYYYLTEGGTWHKDPENGIINAKKIVHYHIQTAMTGCFQANAQFGIGIGGGWTRSNHTYAVMTHFLEDRPVIADIWPENELLWGAVFANPRHATAAVKRLPRAAELSPRWDVPIPPERENDPTKVAVLWSFTGKSCDEIDTDGRLIIEDATGLEAYDMTGRRIRSRGRGLTLPLGEHPVYVTTDTLDAIELRKRISEARIEKVTPVNLYALSLSRPGGEAQELSVRVENQMNCPVSGVLRLEIAGHSGTTSEIFSVGAADLEEVKVAWPGVAESVHRQYAVTLTAECKTIDKIGQSRRARSLGTVKREQLVQTARFVKRTIQIDGSLGDWRGVTPVVLDSRVLKKDVDLTQYLLNPHLSRVDGQGEQKQVVAKVYTAYDRRYVYIAAEVNEDALECSSGEAVKMRDVTLPYRTGMPDGLTHITLCGDVFSFAFGFRDRVPGYGRQMDDPWRWKGYIRDTDYHYVAHTSTDGDKLVRQWGADTDRRNAYQCDDITHVEQPQGSTVKITRDEERKATIYEIAIPRSELKLFDPNDERCRFSFIVYNNEKVGGGSMHWAEAGGVFDHWRNSGSFGPSWNYVLPCQTFFGIDK